MTLFRVGQVEDRAYLVSEYTRGITLDRLKKPIPWPKVLALALDLARGMAAAHRRGVLHRDVKPGNAILTEEGRVKLLDFGLAKLRDLGPPPAEDAPSALPSDDGIRQRVVGTPYYMPPEAWRGEAPTDRADLYSLGAMLYELVTGAAPLRHVPLAELPSHVQRAHVPSVVERVPGVDPRLSAAIDRCLSVDPTERFSSAEALLDALGVIDQASEERPIPKGNPYRGLRPFEPEHRALFFGRGRELRVLLERLRSHGFVLLAGDSGVGKSSLCSAGLVPAIQEGALDEGREWEVRVMVPGRRPLTSLGLALAPHLKESATEITDAIVAAPETLARKLRAGVGDTRGLVIYVDQMEELVTVADPRDARRTSEALAPLAAGLPGLRMLGSVRSDFLTRLAGLPQLGPTVADALFLVPPLGPEELRAAVTGPARVKGVRFESESLISRLVESTTSGGGLPLLQFALAQLWDTRDKAAGVIPEAGLELLGGVEGALARHADAVVDQLSPVRRRAARTVLLSLVSEDGTRARGTADELAGGDVRYEDAIEALVRGRLLVARESPEGSTYEVAHEALLTGWATLAQWLSEEGEHRALRRRLQASALDWERRGGPNELLWPGRLLEESRALDLEALTEREQRFLQASRAGLRRGHRVRLFLVAAVVVALIAVAVGARLRPVLARERAADVELAAGNAIVLEAESLTRAEQEARSHAFEAYGDLRWKVGETRWLEARGLASALDERLAEATASLERALALSPGRESIRSRLAEILLARARRAERRGDNALRDVLAQRLWLVDESGEKWAAWNAPGRLRLTSMPAEMKLERYALSADGRLVPEAHPLAGSAEGTLRRGPEDALELELSPGSYRLSWSEDGGARHLPFTIARGERRTLRVGSTPPGVGDGYVFVPGGEHPFGSNAEEDIREFLNAPPQRTVFTPAFFIARHETTWAEYLAYLEALPLAERRRRTPRAGDGTSFHGGLRVSHDGQGWRLAIRPGELLFEAREGEPLLYPKRERNREVDWSRLPVVGISFDDARAFAEWMSDSGQLPGARLCTEQEWERAARGADLRIYPHGNRLAPEDANFDATYGKHPDRFGPDEVGSHPRSASPFGVHDLAGNVWEWTTSVLEPDRPVARGSSYLFSSSTCRIGNREAPDPGFRDLTVGMRLCVSTSTEEGVLR